MFTLIESYGDAPVTIGSRGFKAPCLVEDDDGLRWFLVDTFERILPGHYTKAVSNGAVALLAPFQDADGGGWHALTVEIFMENRGESDGAYSVEVFFDDAWDAPPSYAKLAQEYPQTLAGDPDEIALGGLRPESTADFCHLHLHTEYCLAPETRVCTADLVWKSIGDVVAGEQLVGFGEDLRAPDGKRGISRSRMERTTVTHTKRVMRDCYRITLVDGTEIVSSAEHGWVVSGVARGSQIEPDGPTSGVSGNSRKWLKTKDLATSHAGTWANREVKLPSLILWAKPWEPEVPEDLRREAAWLAGVADGEAWLDHNTVAFGQNPGLVMDEMQRVCKALGYEMTQSRVQSNRGPCETFRLKGYETALRFLAQCRPVRFAGRTDECWVGKRAGGRYIRPVQIKSVEHLGERETVALTTSTKTFVAEGFLSHNSPMDGRSKVPEAMDRIVALGHGAAADTDHGVCSGHPMWAAEAKKRGIKAIFGIEAYFVADRWRRPVEWWVDEDGNRASEALLESMTLEDRKKKLNRMTDQKQVQYGYNHIVLLAMNNEGLRNIWAASTESFKSFYQVPRMDWDTLAKHNEGVICLTGCLRGPVAVPLIEDDDEMARQNLGRLMEIFEDRLYLEVMPNDMPEQVKVNRGLARLAEEYSLPLVATVDSHYVEESHYRQHQVWVSAQTNKDTQDETDLFSNDLGLYIKDRVEVENGLIGVGLTEAEVTEACDNTVVIADRCSAEIPIKNVRPVFSRKGGEQADAERLMDLCLSNWHLTLGKGYTQDECMARFEHEMGLIIRKGFCGYFLQVAEYVTWAKDNGIMVGPGRGSGGGSLVAYLARITGIDPVEANLLFDRFMTEGRVALPDFDVDFPASKRTEVQDHITERYGEDNVVRVGTHTRLKNKGVFNDMFRALSSTLPETYYLDQKAISDIIGAAEQGTAGIGLSWDELWASEGELLAPYQEKYPEVFAMAEAMVGILKSYGQHPAGLVVSNESIVDALPLRKSDTAQMITQFSLDDLDLMGYIKFDILTLRTLDTIQTCMDMIKANRGIEIDVDSWRVEYEDPQVWEMLAEGHTLGVFQVETATGIRMCKRQQPANMSDLSDVLTLVRPGPMRSGLTDLYLARRDGEEEVSFPDERLSEVLADTYGAILYQEQVMQTCMILAGYDSNKADEVRKILGKKKVELVLAAGKEFVEGCVTNGMCREDADTLWAQLAEFAKYSFGKAHAWGYAVLAYWTAWLKVHYPVEFFTAVLSTVKEDRIPEFVSEARRMGFSILPPDINESEKYFTSQGLNVRYGLASIKGLGDASVDPIIAGQPYASYEDFVERSGADSGKRAILARIGAFDSLVPNRRGLETLLMADKTGASTTCQRKVEGHVNEWVRDTHLALSGDRVLLPCVFDWAEEPPNISTRTNKILKQKPPPKKCTKACRQYLAPQPLDIATIEPYNEADIRNIEYEMLGLHLSSTVFDQIPDVNRDVLLAQADQAMTAPEGLFLLGVVVTKIRLHIDRNDKTMAFFGLTTERGDIDCTVFSSTWDKYKRKVEVGDLRLVEVSKNDRGFLLNYLAEPPTK